jgi:solute carrier family 25 (mitochondrial thiamine pyrophosphate transporter), member 19
MVHAARGIVKQNGAKGLFTGVNITLLEIIPYAGIQFGVYDMLNRTSDKFLTKHGLEKNPQLAFSRQFLVGFLAGLIGKVHTYPTVLLVSLMH